MSRRVSIVTRRVEEPARRPCGWCRRAVPSTARRDAKFCSKSCRQASWRFGRECDPSARPHVTTAPLKLAYADPPYPGKAGYYRDHPDYAGEVDHRELIETLAAAYDGWALSTSAHALQPVLALCPAGGAWVRGGRGGAAAWPLSSWEPVIYAGGRRIVSPMPGDDSLVYAARARTTDPERVIGAKPAKFAYWLFDLLGARAGDELHDLYPGSRGIARAWDVFSSKVGEQTAERAKRPLESDADVTRASAEGDRSPVFDVKRSQLRATRRVGISDTSHGPRDETRAA